MGLQRCSFNLLFLPVDACRHSLRFDCAALLLSPLSPQAVDIMVALTGSEEVPVKKLLLWLEMARQELPDPAGKITLQAWTKVLQNLSTGHSSNSGFSKNKFAM